MPETTIASFVLRFTREHDAGETLGAGWRGVIRHVQTSEETRFTRMKDALVFIARYVDVNGEGADSERMTE